MLRLHPHNILRYALIGRHRKIIRQYRLRYAVEVPVGKLQMRGHWEVLHKLRRALQFCVRWQVLNIGVSFAKVLQKHFMTVDVPC